MIKFKIQVIALATVAALSACSSGESADKASVVVSIGKQQLTADEIRQHIPAGIPVEDSTSLAKAYIRQWIDERLILEVAPDIVDMEEIDRLTQQYRADLVMARYRREMAQQASDGVFAEDSMMAFYNANPDLFVLERPMVQGVYLKVPDDSRDLPAIRKLYRSKSTADMDRLQKLAQASAVQFDYFHNRWVDMEQIETRIPIAINPDGMTQAPSAIDISSGGFVYLFSPSKYLPAGAKMPYEAAKPLVRERLLTLKRISYDQQLRTDLLKQAVDKGTVKFPAGNPLK